MLMGHDIIHVRDLTDRHSVPGDSPVVHDTFIFSVSEACSYTSFPTSKH